MARTVATQSYRYVDRNMERTAEFPVDRKDDVAGVIASASSGPLRDYQDKLKAIQLREKGLSKADIAEKLGRSEYWVKRWWREHPATIERPAGANDIVLQKASLNSFRDLDIRRSFLDDSTLFGSLVQRIPWRQAKVVARDDNTGELGLRFDRRGSTINAGRQVADYAGGVDVLDKLLQRVFTEMDIRDPQARVFMNYYADGWEKTGTHRHDFWTCLLSFGAPRILTVDNRPILLRDGDLIVFGTQNHGVPVMPGLGEGRISLVIFFYPDADNLERQWQTIAEDDGGEEGGKAGGGAVGKEGSRIGGLGVDHGFNAAILWGEAHSAAPHDSSGFCSGASNGAGHAELSALASVLDPTTERRALVKSPNSQLQFGGTSGAVSASGAKVVYSITCSDSIGDPVAAEKEFFGQLKAHGVGAIWDMRLRSYRESWCALEALRQACAVRLVKYRSYPLGRREAGGPSGHVRSEEGQDVLRRLLAAAAQEPVAFLTSEESWRRPGELRTEVADCLAAGGLGRARVLHISQQGVEEHPPPPDRPPGPPHTVTAEAEVDPDVEGATSGSVAAVAPAPAQTDARKGSGARWSRGSTAGPQPAASSQPEASGAPSAEVPAPDLGADGAGSCPPAVAEEAAPQRRGGRWGRRRAEA